MPKVLIGAQNNDYSIQTNQECASAMTVARERQAACKQAPEAVMIPQEKPERFIGAPLAVIGRITEKYNTKQLKLPSSHRTRSVASK